MICKKILFLQSQIKQEGHEKDISALEQEKEEQARIQKENVVS